MDIILERVDDIYLFRLGANLDVANVSEMWAHMAALPRDQNLRSIVDLSRTEFVDSAGIGVLVSLYKRVREDRGRLCFCGVDGQPLSLLRSLKVDEVVPIYADFAEAAGSF